MAVPDQAEETTRKETAQRETQPVVVPPPPPAAAAAAAREDVTGGEAEAVAEDEHKLLQGLFAVRKLSSGAAIGESSIAAGTGAKEGDDRLRAMTKSQFS